MSLARACLLDAALVIAACAAWTALDNKLRDRKATR